MNDAIASFVAKRTYGLVSVAIRHLKVYLNVNRSTDMQAALAHLEVAEEHLRNAHNAPLRVHGEAITIHEYRRLPKESIVAEYGRPAVLKTDDNTWLFSGQTERTKSDTEMAGTRRIIYRIGEDDTMKEIA